MRGALLMFLVACGARPIDTSGTPSTPGGVKPGEAPNVGETIVANAPWPLQGIAVDETFVYFMGEGTLRAIPKAGMSAWQTIARDQTPTSGLAVADGSVWWVTASDIRCASTAAGRTGNVHVVLSGVAPKPGFVAAVGQKGFFIDSATENLIDSSGVVIVDAEGAPWALTSFDGRVYVASATSIRSMLPDGSDMTYLPYAPPALNHIHHHFAVGPDGPVFVDELPTKVYGRSPMRMIVGGASPIAIENEIYDLGVAGTGVYVLASKPPPPPPSCKWLTDPNCPLMINLDFAPSTAIVRVDLGTQVKSLVVVAPFELRGLATDATFAYFGRGPSLFSNAEIDRVR